MPLLFLAQVLSCLVALDGFRLKIMENRSVSVHYLLVNSLKITFKEGTIIRPWDCLNLL